MGAPLKQPILVIDDSHEDIFLLKRLLTRAGVSHPIVTTDTGEEGRLFLRACAQEPGSALMPHLVFCDARMPATNGYDILRWVRQQKRLAELPFYMMSGSDLELDRARALDVRATDYLLKFPSPAALADLVRRHDPPA